MRVAGVLVRSGRMDRVHQAELVLTVLLALEEVMFSKEFLLGLWVHLLLNVILLFFDYIECWSG